MWSVRMRASGRDGTHISGAEGLYEREELERAIRLMAGRALAHPRGIPAEMDIRVEKLRKRPRRVRALPLYTLRCGSPREAERIMLRLLNSLGISDRAVRTAVGVLRGKNAMRGAAIVEASTGGRLDTDRRRGVRVSRIGIVKRVRGTLGRRLSRLGINTVQVKEALTLASKVASCPAVVAEVCVSDDPDYTTGYLASRNLGYLRIPRIKSPRSRRGGRVFFMRGSADIEHAVDYLEKTPVIISELSSLRRMKSPDGFSGSNNS